MDYDDKRKTKGVNDMKEIEITFQKYVSAQGEYMGFLVQDDSMEPRIMSGDVVIIHKQDDCETGDVAVVLVSGDSYTIRRVEKMSEGVLLVPDNPDYEPAFYSSKKIKSLPVKVVGKVVELIAKI